MAVRRARTVLALIIGVAALLGRAGPVAAADAVVFGKPSASSTFGKFIEFRLPVTIVGDPQRVEVLLDTPGAIGPTVIPTDDEAGIVELVYRVDLSDGHVVPNTTFTARWRVTDATGRVWVGPRVRHTYDDDRFTWKSLDGDVVTVHWIEGDQAFGRRALQIGDAAVAETAKLLGVTESDPIDFFIYGDEDTFRAALGPATRENVGGQAHPDIRTLFALITPADIDASWVESVVPHELTHLVFATAVDNPYHDPPHWLNEGLAVYLADGYDDFDRQQVEAAARDGSIIPLDGLAGAFPTTQERFFLAYAESVSAVDRIVRVAGRDALVKLIRSYAEGVSDDAAFEAALGRNVAGFEADWLGELGTKPPARLGPRAAPGGPLPSGWTGPEADPSAEIVGSQPPVTPGAPGPVPRGSGDDPIRFLVGPIASLGLVVIVVLAIVAYRRVGRKTDPASWAETGDNRLFGRPPSGDGPDGAATSSDPSAAQSSRLWSSPDWSLPRDPDGDAAAGPDMPPSSEAPTDAPSPELPTDGPSDAPPPPPPPER